MPSTEEKPDPVWLIVANVVKERPFGEDGGVRNGTRLFKGGAKVHIVSGFPGSGKVTVIGRHRKSLDCISVITETKHLTTFRTKLVYSPRILELVRRDHYREGWHGGSQKQRLACQSIAHRLRTVPYEDRRWDSWSYGTHRTSRPARIHDLAWLSRVELAAAQSFDTDRMTPAQRVEIVPFIALRCAQQEGRLWVTCDYSSEERPVGFALAEHARDGSAAVLAEMSVHPDHQQRGIGLLLVGEAADWARAQGYDALTLTTFADVPFNAPWYERLGFERVAEADLTADLAQRLADEAARGFTGRVAMRLRLA